MLRGRLGEEPQSADGGIPQSPFQIAVSDESYNGDLLMVQASVTGAIQWSPQDVAVRLVGYRNGEIVGSSAGSVAALAWDVAPAAVIDAGGSVPISVSLNSADISNYQLELLWGGDAQAVVSPKDVPLIHSVRVEEVECGAQDDCERQYRISAVLRNETSAELDAVKLGVSYAWTPDSGALVREDIAPESEEVVEVSALGLKPGEENPLSILVPVVHTNQPGGRFEPHVRLISEG